jgi:succinate-semialdehyde dehydrogenase/glutarate-semialdehyde dehydrogenase
LIDGELVDGDSGELPVLDKFRLTPVAMAGLPSRAQLDAAVEGAARAFRAGAPVAARRGAILEQMAMLVQRDADELVALVQAEAGFTASDGAGEVRRCIETLKLSAAEARSLSGEMIPLEGAPDQEGRLGFTIRVPLGVVLAITPFNSPINTVVHKIAPAFAAGNAVILKPSSATPMTALKLCKLFVEAGMPRGFLSLLYGGGEMVARLLERPEIRYIAFTGSTEVGRVLQAQAGLRRTQMELGSIAFTILCADADLDTALPKVVNAAYRKAGQVCTSIQTLLVHESLLDGVTERLTAMVKALPYGDPRLATTVTGPLITEAAAIRVEQWIDDAMAKGARLLAGGPRAAAVVPPTLLSGIDGTMRIGCEEVFGPVMGIQPFATLDEALARVNATPYGLATGIFTNRINEAFRAVRGLEVGTVHVNETSSSRVDMMPYGGSKDSGFGREGPHHAVREMSEERMVTFTGFRL